MMWMRVVGVAVLAAVLVGCVVAAPVEIPHNHLRPHVSEVDHNGLGVTADPPEVFKSAFQDFKSKLLDKLNAQKRTGSDGEPLNFVDAEVLGFPPSPIPTDGDITKDMLSQTGGIKLVEGDAVKFASRTVNYVPTNVDSAWFTNDNPRPATHQHEYSQEFTSTTEASVSEGTTETTKTSITLGVFFVSTTVETTTVIETNTDATSSTSETTTWLLRETVNVGPHKVSNSTCFLSTGVVDTTWSGSVVASDDTPVGWVYYDDRERTKESGNFWIERADQSYIGLKRWKKMAGGGLEFAIPVTGSYKGDVGVKVDCVVHECPYSPDRTRCE